MIEFLPVSIGIGLAVSLLLSELFGIAAGGMVVPGYIALHLTRPVDLILTLFASLVTFGIVHSLANVMIIYGRRRTALAVLLGYIAGVLTSFLGGSIPVVAQTSEFHVIGHIVPGLIAIWMDRQGVFETLAAVAISSVIVRLILILIFGADLAI